jgi:hypothetical protein
MKSVLLLLLTVCLLLPIKPSFAQIASAPQSTSTDQSASSHSDKALVTFFASGHVLKSAAPGYKYGKFIGRIMERDDQLAMLMSDCFVTFLVDAGSQTFSANSWLFPTPEMGGHLELKLVAGKHYFIGAYTQSFLYYTRFRLEEKTCQEAKQENEKTKALDPKHLKPYGKGIYVAETAFPVCP